MADFGLEFEFLRRGHEDIFEIKEEDEEGSGESADGRPAVIGSPPSVPVASSRMASRLAGQVDTPNDEANHHVSKPI